MTDVVTLGECMALLVPPSVGLLRHQRSLDLRVGGSEATVAIGVRRLGGSAAWTGRVGSDEFGALIRSTLLGEGVDAHVIADPCLPTALMVKERPAAGATRVRYYRHGYAGSALCPGDLDPVLFGSAKIVHVTGITAALSPSARAAVSAAIDLAKDAGALVSFDLNYRSALWEAAEAAPVLAGLAARSDVLFATAEEACLLVDAPDETGLALGLAALGPSQVLLKRGSLGAVAVIDGTVSDVPVVPVTAVDPVGAGDAFAAGYLTSLAHGRPVPERLAAASAAGAFAVTAPGDWEGLPLAADLDLLAHPGEHVLR